MPLNRKAGLRRLVDMSPDLAVSWAPDLPPVEPAYEQWFPIGDNAAYHQKLLFDERNRLVEWVVIQSRRVDGQWRNVAVYDMCHNKGAHVHVYDRTGREFAETTRAAITNYQDVQTTLDEALDQVVKNWREYERRSDRGY